nr:PepSY-associated TM helix domain-containing protein [Noviherbaspirillum massiliense]
MPAERAADNKRSRRAIFLKWLRKMHGWIGLWGAVLGLLFGSTGVLLNHRAVMKIPAAHAQESTLQLPLPDPTPADATEMVEWLQRELGFDRPASRVRSEPARPVAWGDKSLKQPARWSAMFSSARMNAQVEYWVGNNFVSVKRSDNNVFATLNNLHKGVGGSIAWILLVDTLAGSIILLSITGVLLWAMMNRRRMLGAGIGFAGLAATVILAMQAM